MPAMITHVPALLAGLPPVLNIKTQILILGSFPGTASLAAGQYYAHPRNQFWRLMSALLDEDLISLVYAERVQRLAAHHIGLWDVISSCVRSGSLDSAIRQPQQSDFSIIKTTYPAIHTIGFNGKTAGKAALAFESAGYRALVLPSSSPANAQLSFSQKLVQWQQLLG